MSQIYSLSSSTNAITTITTDAGNATPVAGVVNVLGGTNIGTTGAANNVTINLDPSIILAGSITVGTSVTVNSFANGVVLSSAAGLLSSLNTGVAGTVLMSNGAGVAPSWQAVSTFTWSGEAGAAVAMAVDHGYINQNIGLTTFTLPLAAALGTIIEVCGEGAGGWTIAQNAGQNIQFGALSTTPGVGGSLSSSNRYDTVRLVCRVANTTWSVLSSVGILTIV